MNKGKWKKGDPGDTAYMAKLMEEVGEAAERYGQCLEADWMGPRDAARSKLMDELEHVEFIASCWRSKLTKGLTADGRVVN